MTCTASQKNGCKTNHNLKSPAIFFVFKSTVSGQKQLLSRTTRSRKGLARKPSIVRPAPLGCARTGAASDSTACDPCMGPTRAQGGHWGEQGESRRVSRGRRLQVQCTRVDNCESAHRRRSERRVQCACVQASGFEAMWLGHVLVVGQLRGRGGLHAMVAGALDNWRAGR